MNHSSAPIAIRTALRDLAQHPDVGLDALGVAMGVDSRSGVSRRLDGQYAITLQELTAAISHFQDRRWRPAVQQCARRVGHALAQCSGAFAMGFDAPEVDTLTAERSAIDHAMDAHADTLSLLELVVQRQRSSGDLRPGDLSEFCDRFEALAQRMLSVAQRERSQLAVWAARLERHQST